MERLTATRQCSRFLQDLILLLPEHLVRHLGRSVVTVPPLSAKCHLELREVRLLLILMQRFSGEPSDVENMIIGTLLSTFESWRFILKTKNCCTL